MHEEQILEAIDQLRRRKARPDADRICNYLLRKCSVDARDTIADLHRLIEAEKVIQVDYKGNTSYRNASKWTRLQLYKNNPEGFVKEKLNSSVLAGAVAELVVAEPDYLDQGVPADRLIEQLLNGSTNPTTRRVVDDFLAKEVASGNLTRLNNGNYSLVATPEMTHETIQETYRENGTRKGSQNLSMVNSYDFAECDDMTIVDSRSNTPRSSRQTSPKQDPLKTEDCYEIIIGTKQSLQNSQKENSGPKSRSRFTETKVDAVNGGNNNSNLKKTSKSERKQRLEVRSEEPLEIEIKYADYRREQKDERDRREQKEERDRRELKADRDRREQKEERERREQKEERDRREQKEERDRRERKYERDRREQKEERDHREESGQFSEERDDDDAGRSSTNPSPTPSSTNAGGFRSARRKVKSNHMKTRK